MIKPLSEMTSEELRAAILDPIGPDYVGYREMAKILLYQRQAVETNKK